MVKRELNKEYLVISPTDQNIKDLTQEVLKELNRVASLLNQPDPNWNYEHDRPKTWREKDSLL